MSIERVFAELTPRLADALGRESAGETVKWAGRNPGLGDRIQGFAVVSAGAALALANLGGPLSAVGLLVDLIERGRMPSGGYAAIGLGALGFIAGLALAWLGWRSVRASRDVAWAVTDRRLLRIVDGDIGAQVWRRRDLSDLERLNWNEPKRRAFAMTARCHPECELRLILTGPADIPAAEAAVRELAD